VDDEVHGRGFGVGLHGSRTLKCIEKHAKQLENIAYYGPSQGHH
jgi:hypothetical protein